MFISGCVEGRVNEFAKWEGFVGEIFRLKGHILRLCGVNDNLVFR